jgi:anti-sigma factor RsiW
VKHPDLKALLRLVRGALADEEASETFAHLAECDSCHRRAAELRNLRDDFEGTWALFLREAAGRATAEAPAHVLRIVAFVRSAAQGAVAALHGSMRDQGWAGEPLLDAPGFAGPAGPRAGEELARLRRACESGSWDEVEAALVRLAAIDPARASVSILEIGRGGKRVARVAVDARRRVVSVLLDRDPERAAEGGEAPDAAETAFLRRPDGGVSVAPFQDVPSADYLLAEFTEIGDGPFEIGIPTR